MSVPTRPEGGLLEFPCSFPLKVMGLDAEGFHATVVEIVRRHAPDLEDAAVSSRPSRGGKYVSVTVVIEARSQDQLDALYRELSGHERVMMVL